jgi:hypothetical protein
MLMNQQLELNRRMIVQGQAGIQIGHGTLEWSNNDEFYDMMDIIMKSTKMVSGILVMTDNNVTLNLESTSQQPPL